MRISSIGAKLLAALAAWRTTVVVATATAMGMGTATVTDMDMDMDMDTDMGMGMGIFLSACSATLHAWIARVTRLDLGCTRLGLT